MMLTRIRYIFLTLLLCTLPTTLLAWKMESGSAALPATATTSTTWVTVNLQQTYDSVPLIFALPDSGAGYPADRHAALRVRNITTTSFEMIQVEPPRDDNDSDGSHPAMTVHYLAIEPGNHILPNGTRLLAGSVITSSFQAGNGVTGTESWEPVAFAPFAPFAGTPAVLAMIQTMASDSATPGQPSFPWLTTATNNITATGLDVALERSEVNRSTVTSSETIGWLAFDANVQGSFYDDTCTRIEYETISTDRVVRGWENVCTNVGFVNSYSAAPNVLANKNLRSGGDGGWLRRCDLTPSGIGLAVDEDQYRDLERRHTTEMVGIFAASGGFVFTSDQLIVCSDPIAEYRMDECFWSGITGDIKDTSASASDSTSQNSANTFETGAKQCRSGDFVDAEKYAEVDTSFTLASDWTLSAWVELPLDPAGHDTFGGTGTAHMFGSVTGASSDLAYLWMVGADLQWGVCDGGTCTEQDIVDLPVGWHHFVVVKSGSSTTLHINGGLADTIALGATGDVEVLLESTDSTPGFSQSIGANTDELKIWDSALTPTEIGALYSLEIQNKNLDGSDRICGTCSASTAANTWELIGIPADDRAALPGDPITVGEIFSDDVSGNINTDWVIYERSYSAADNSSWYTQLTDVNDTLSFGKGYWFGTRLAETWDTDGQVGVDYDSTNPACTANRCVEIDARSVSLNFGAPDNDPDDGSGPYRYNFTGFVGTKPVDWADVRFLVEEDPVGAPGVLTAFTPAAVRTAGYAEKQIWQYNPGNADANAQGYTACDDSGIGTCKLLPYEGFLMRLLGPSKGKTVKLLIPQE